MSFHQKLKEARIAAGFTQSQMAARMGLDKTSYSGYETGRRQPNLQRLRQMSQLLQVSADSLLEISSQDQATPPGALCPAQVPDAGFARPGTGGAGAGQGV